MLTGRKVVFSREKQNKHLYKIKRSALKIYEQVTLYKVSRFCLGIHICMCGVECLGTEKSPYIEGDGSNPGNVVPREVRARITLSLLWACMLSACSPASPAL